MRIGLIDADLMDNGTRHPNLAIMKLAGFYRDQGHQVALIWDSYKSVFQYEKVFLSKVFTFTSVPEWVLQLDFVTCGGTGFFENGGDNLPDEIEHYKPYYDIYRPYVEAQIAGGRRRSYFQDYLDYSIGFTTRGCFRKCSFCVNKKYDHVFRHSPVKEFLDEERPFLYLWDDNFLGYPGWEEVLDDIESAGKPFQFRQGIDLRLMTDQKARRLVSARYQGDFIFAFDYLEDKAVIIDKLQLWKRYSSKVCKLYVLVAYKSQDAADIDDAFQRIHTLMKLGSIPYIMRYEAYKDSPLRSLYIELARWCNQPNFFKKMSFREFCLANQRYKKDQETNCSAYQAMLDFQRSNPEIAAKYFDLRFDQESIYQKQYGYGRRYANKPLCKTCRQKGVCWEAFSNGQCGGDALLTAYLTKQIDLECLRYQNAECRVNRDYVMGKLAALLLETPEARLVELLRQCTDLEPVTQANIPQYGTLTRTYRDVPMRLFELGEAATFEDLGIYITRDEPDFVLTPVAKKKYGENHAKLAAQMDLVLIDRALSSHKVELSQFGGCFCRLPAPQRELLAAKLRFRVPIVQQYYIQGEHLETIDEYMKILSPTTHKRRRKNVIDVVQWNLQEPAPHPGVCGGG